MATAEVRVLHPTTLDAWEKAITSSLPVLVDFYADWCGPCRSLGPILEAAANEQKELKWILVKVNVDDLNDVSDKFGVSGIPAVFLLKNKQSVANFVGSKDAKAVQAFLAENGLA